ncbi:hypothetical protein NDI37_00710 [Funiculus sociatus GB2-A5]|uniref:ATPase n=1 Tax=Funiculus sociatus GB2-A5 TaxID=2933946 RepID=A0ABV0JHR9_9CYAN|nr:MULTISPECIES: hypothetical protein [unclassified Trichocoleus]MBD1904489.1 hypothetical protein [Trichocoleus sp. FACHB-832]MBD2064420.1 hypothetical protein [Trichocoleus sp. FACHB-6]
MESIDDILASVKAEYEVKDNPKPLHNPQQLKEKLVSPHAIAPSVEVAENFPLQPGKNNLSYSHEDSVLAQVKAEFEEQEKAEKLKKQQQLAEKKIKQEQIKQQQKEALASQAKEWLKNLNSLSEEGLWFEEFAYAYPSKLDAAIDYLQALRETQP